MHLISQNTVTGQGSCFYFAVVSFLSLLLMSLGMIVLTFLLSLQLQLQFYCCLIFGRSKKVSKHLELSFILNLSVLAVSTYHISLSGGSQTVVTYISVCVAFLTFLGILVYHVCVQIKSKVQYIQRGHQLHNRNNQCHDIVEAVLIQRTQIKRIST